MPAIADDYARIERAIRFLDTHFPEQPALEEVARSVNLSPHHFQRVFKRWAGISPKRFLQHLTLDYAKRTLQESPNLLDAAYATGLSSPSRLHDLFVTVEAVTPGEFRRHGEGLPIEWGFAETPFGECLIAATARGICSLSFVLADDRRATFAAFESNWPKARFAERPETARGLARRIFAWAGGRPPFHLFLKGTNFQIKVWEALLKIPAGAVTTYEAVAELAGKPKAIRAAGSAVGDNPIAFLIPCHRVIRKTGALGGYGGGISRKRAMLAWEAAHWNEAAKSA